MAGPGRGRQNHDGVDRSAPHSRTPRTCPAPRATFDNCSRQSLSEIFPEALAREPIKWQVMGGEIDDQTAFKNP